MARDSLIKIRRGAAATWTSTNPTLAAGELGYETDTGKLKIGDGSTAWTSLSYFAGGGGGSVTYGTPALTLGTSNAAGSTDESMRRDATVAVFDATNPTTQAFGDSAAVGSAGVASRRDHKHAMPTIEGGIHAASSKTTPDDADEFGIVDSAASNVLKKLSGTNLKAYLKSYFDGIYGSVTPPIGSSSLVYRYTVTGSDKASIDTGSDTPDAGSNDWTNGDLLEIVFYGRTDQAVVRAGALYTFNNDTNNNYDQESFSAVNTTVSAAPSLARANIALNVTGASAAANFFGSNVMRIPNYRGTVGYKNGSAEGSVLDTAAGTTNSGVWAVGWRDTSAISRVAVATAAGQKFKVGSQLLIYKRLAS